MYPLRAFCLNISNQYAPRGPRTRGHKVAVRILCGFLLCLLSIARPIGAVSRVSCESVVKKSHFGAGDFGFLGFVCA